MSNKRISDEELKSELGKYYKQQRIASIFLIVGLVLFFGGILGGVFGFTVEDISAVLCILGLVLAVVVSYYRIALTKR